MDSAEKLYELVKALPEDQAAEVLDFAEFLLHRSKLRAEQNETQKEAPQAGRLLSEYAGILKDSPNFNEDPVELQRKMRDEWS
ncbi:MAG: DUF2281 domain-containing protein [Drouetiella hepatica Uher 2000/2452]|jgi:hypothetical protein|uniref:DUF2281 domain-containing protein n=1 Tax=Drouetiella hepatica Uher 2000/2452 TaxID=904376 RepID=A0A951QIX2_9CYAN|nr:DUF2281 domain-containing protein [Drouetiella hepatica Uher 2000/2452]